MAVFPSGLAPPKINRLGDGEFNMALLPGKSPSWPRGVT